MRALPLTFVVVPVLNVVQQLCLKLGAAQTDGAAPGLAWLAQLLGAPWFLAAVVAEVVCFAVWMTILADMALSLAFPLSAASYVLTMALGWFGFGEPVRPVEVLGSLAILTGLWCIATAEQ